MIACSCDFELRACECTNDSSVCMGVCARIPFEIASVLIAAVYINEYTYIYAQARIYRYEIDKYVRKLDALDFIEEILV